MQRVSSWELIWVKKWKLRTDLSWGVRFEKWKLRSGSQMMEVKKWVLIVLHKLRKYVHRYRIRFWDIIPHRCATRMWRVHTHVHFVQYGRLRKTTTWRNWRNFPSSLRSTVSALALSHHAWHYGWPHRIESSSIPNISQWIGNKLRIWSTKKRSNQRSSSCRCHLQISMNPI